MENNWRVWMMCVCDNGLSEYWIGWKMDWWMWKVDVESGAVPDLTIVAGFWVRINAAHSISSATSVSSKSSGYKETRFLALSSICSMFNDVTSERNPNVLLIPSYAFIRFSSSANRLSIMTLNVSRGLRFASFKCSFSSGIRFRLRPRRCSDLYSLCWTFSVAICAYTSNLSHANWTVSTNDAIKPVDIYAGWL